MARTTLDTWNPNCIHGSLFEPLSPLASYLNAFGQHWPSHCDYQHILDESSAPIVLHNKKTIRFVPQDGNACKFEQYYEPRIYLQGEVQTRLENWHDFFQVLVWRIFPKTKVALNAQHYHAAKQRSHPTATKPNRSPIENAVTLFDECGAIIVTSNPDLLELIKEHRWKELFWQQRETLSKQLKCIVFGHALYEKALKPYIGMTAQCLTLTVEEKHLTLPIEQLTTYCDDRLAQSFAVDSNIVTSPKDLLPFPLLGMPGWYADNNQEAFYDNSSYFRPKNRFNEKSA